MSCVCVDGGGGCSVAQTTVQEYLTGFGVTYNPADNLPYQVVLAAHSPAGIGSFAFFYKQLGEACLRSRAILMCNKTPGDCGSITNPSTAASQAFQFQTIGQVGSAGISIGGAALSAAGTLTGPLLGVATAGAGLALSVVLEIFQNHAAAEQRQTNVLCQLCPQFTTLIREVDAAVFSGQASPQQGIATLQQAAQSFRNAVSQYYKPCNAFCAYCAICDAMADISQYYYGLIPIPENVTAAINVNGQETEVPQNGAGIIGSTPVAPSFATSGNVLVPISTPSSANPTALLGTNVSPLAIAAAVLFAILLFRK